MYCTYICLYSPLVIYICVSDSICICREVMCVPSARFVPSAVVTRTACAAALHFYLLRCAMQNGELSERCDTLATNISSLYNTAKLELQRKDAEIKELRERCGGACGSALGCLLFVDDSGVQKMRRMAWGFVLLALVAGCICIWPVIVS